MRIPTLISFLATLILLGLFGAVSAGATEQIPREMMRKMATTQMKKSCANPDYLSCVGFSGASCKSMIDQYDNQCLKSLPEMITMDEAQEKHIETCGESVARSLNVDLDRLERCEQQIEKMADQQWQQQLDQMSPEEAQQAMSQKQQAQLQEMMNLMREATGGDSRLSEISLPLFQPSQLQMHFADGQMMGAANGLPVATFQANADKQAVLAFYRSKLPNYKPLPQDPYILVEKLVDGGGYPVDYMQIPHVSIYGAGGITMFQLVYRK